jgi:hypothetical protein
MALQTPMPPIFLPAPLCGPRRLRKSGDGQVVVLKKIER